MDLNSIKTALRNLLGEFYEPIRDYLFGPAWGAITIVTDSSHNLFWLYLLSALAAAFWGYVYYSGRKGHLSFPGFLKFFAPREILAHPSSIVDYKFYFTVGFVHRIVYGGTLLGAIGSAGLFSGQVKRFLEWFFGESGGGWEPTILAQAVYTILALMAYDLGVFLGHFLEHKIPFFWEFHKVHHSAEVLNPLTNYRNHPVDKLLENFFVSVFLGITVGVYGYLFSSQVTAHTILNISTPLFIYMLVANLRHSHIWISYGKYLSYVFSSPAMHQIHHSADEKHFDKNYALIFSFWDYLAGSLYIPKEREKLTWGINNMDSRSYDSVWKLYLLPCVAAFSTLRWNRRVMPPAVEQLEK